MNMEIRASNVLQILLTAIACLTVCDIAVLWLRFGADHDYVYGLVPLFDFNEEMNVPTFYSSIVILIAAALLACIAASRRSHGEPGASWYGLSAVFFFLAFDENTGIHELLQSPATRVLDATGMLYHAWIVPYGIVALILCVVFLRLFCSLPRRSMVLFAASATLFLSGAIGMEAIGGSYLEANGDDLRYHVLTTIEEILEMIGIAVFIYSLLDYMESRQLVMTVSIGTPCKASAETGLRAFATAPDIKI